MKVSIITVCYNSEKTIADALLSISNQDYKNIESVVIDGGSTDKTFEIVRQFADVVKFSVSEPDKGIYDAMNKGLQHCTGDIIGILNSDDMLASPKVISSIVEKIGNLPLACIYGDLVYVDQVKTNKIIRYWKSGSGSPRKFYFGWMPPHPGFYITRQVLEKCGEYNIDFPVAADYEYMLRVMVRYNIPSIYLPLILVKMRLGGLSNQSVASRKSSFIENHLAWKVNNLKPYFFTVWLKIARKFSQYLRRPASASVE